VTTKTSDLLVSCIKGGLEDATTGIQRRNIVPSNGIAISLHRGFQQAEWQFECLATAPPLAGR
jgi:hypothetical protein